METLLYFMGFPDGLSLIIWVSPIISVLIVQKIQVQHLVAL